MYVTATGKKMTGAAAMKAYETERGVPEADAYARQGNIALH